MVKLTEKFISCHEFTARMEGGFTDDPADAGGVTNYGVCMRFLSDLEKTHKDVLLSCGIATPVTRQTIVGMTALQAARLFFLRMWSPMRCQELPLAVAQCVYDMGVNHGVSGGVKICQRAANTRGADLVVDGVLGPKTFAALCALNSADGIGALGAARVQFYENILSRRPSQAVFRRGWMRRAEGMLSTALGMLLE